MNENLVVLASYLQPDDVVVHVGGGPGRISLALARRCKQVINVDPSTTMGAAFLANAAKAGIDNVSFVEGGLLDVEPPPGTLTLVNHMTYFARDIRAFIERLEIVGRRRIIIMVNDPPPPSVHGALYQLLHDEPEEVVPGHVELLNVLWEMDILPDVIVLPRAGTPPAPESPTREAAIGAAMDRFLGAQWAFWPLGPDLEQRLHDILDKHFDDLFLEKAEGTSPRWLVSGREVLITWRPTSDRRSS
jgi:SAM-dependent methyltransferase